MKPIIKVIYYKKKLYWSYVDLYETGIIDPAKVTRSALQNATSIAAMILTTECLIVEKNG